MTDIILVAVNVQTLYVLCMCCQKELSFTLGSVKYLRRGSFI